MSPSLLFLRLLPVLLLLLRLLRRDVECLEVAAAEGASTVPWKNSPQRMRKYFPPALKIKAATRLALICRAL
jgi:hypothetical protein